MNKIFLTGASAGIGLATAKLLAGRGDEVWGTSRDCARIPQIPGLHPVCLDLRDINSLRQSFRTFDAPKGMNGNTRTLSSKIEASRASDTRTSARY